MKLYYHPLSTYSQKVMLALMEKGINYQPHRVELMNPEARAEYEKIHPLGKIPSLLPPPDRLVAESTSIVEYLEWRFPQAPRLIPQTPAAAWEVRSWDRWSDLYLNDPVVELLFQQTGFRAPDVERAARARKHLAATYSRLDQRLAGRDWICEAFSLADCATIPALYYSQSVASFEGLSNLEAYWQRANARPSYQRVRSEFEPIWEAMMARSDGTAPEPAGVTA